jgi:hypothetical protein
MPNPKDSKAKKSKAQDIPESAQNLMHLWDPHIESFNYFLGDGLKHAIAGTDPLVMDLEAGRLICIYSLFIFN